MKVSEAMACLTVVAVGLLLSGCPSRRANFDETPASNAIVRSESGASTTVHGIGYVEPVSEVHALSFKTGGVISDCSVSIGDSVNEGDTLMVLDDAEERVGVAMCPPVLYPRAQSPRKETPWIFTGRGSSRS